MIVIKKGDISDKEVEYFTSKANIDHSKKIIRSMELTPDDEFMNVQYEFEPVKFERIRRVTGYLTTTEKANDGKRAEITDRVKHN